MHRNAFAVLIAGVIIHLQSVSMLILSQIALKYEQLFLIEILLLLFHHDWALKKARMQGEALCICEERNRVDSINPHGVAQQARYVEVVSNLVAELIHS